VLAYVESDIEDALPLIWREGALAARVPAYQTKQQGKEN
jgi:hypothetical protein